MAGVGAGDSASSQDSSSGSISLASLTRSLADLRLLGYFTSLVRFHQLGLTKASFQVSRVPPAKAQHLPNVPVVQLGPEISELPRI